MKGDEQSICITIILQNTTLMPFPVKKKGCHLCQDIVRTKGSKDHVYKIKISIAEFKSLKTQKYRELRTDV